MLHLVLNKEKYQNPKKPEVGDQAKNEVVEYSLKRVMKNLNNYILNEYQKLFFSKEKDAKTSRNIQSKEFYTNEHLLRKAKNELQFCEDKKISAVELIKSCLSELEAQGFLNTLEGEADEYLYQIRDQRDKLKNFISEELQSQQAGKGMNFD